MKRHVICIAMAIFAASSSQAQSAPETREYSRKGELSPGTAAPSAAAMVAAIEQSAPGKLRATLEYGERVACLACVPLLEAKLLGSADARVRELSAWWLRRQPFAAPGILTRLKGVVQSDPSAERRARAAEALGEFMDTHALSALTAAARGDADERVRAAAVRALARLNDEGSAPVLAQALADPALSVRAAALDVVVQVRAFRDYAALIPLLGDADAALRAHAATVLGELRIAAAENPLGALLIGDPTPRVRKAAAWALGRIGGASVGGLLTQQHERERDPLVLSAIEIARHMKPVVR